MYRDYEAQELGGGRKEEGTGRGRTLERGGREGKGEEGGEGLGASRFLALPRSITSPDDLDALVSPAAPRPKRARHSVDPYTSPHALPSFSTGHIVAPHTSLSPSSPPHAQSLELQKAYVEREKEGRIKLARGARE